MASALAALGAFLLATVAASAQTMNPRLVEFDPSPDHATVSTDGSPLVTSYSLDVYQAGASQPFHRVDMGKPAPATDGKIRFDFSAQVSAWPLPGGVYEARVNALGPFGTAASEASNAFMFGAACTYSLSASSAAVAAAQGTQSVTLTTSSGCPWSAASTAGWLTVAPLSGSGSATVTLSYSANPQSSARTATMSVGGLTFTVTQSGASCSFSVSPATANVASAAGTLTLAVSTPTGCAWTASTTATWLSVVTPSGSGTGEARVSFSANSGAASRSGSVTVAGRTVNVTQAGATCSYALSTTAATLATAGGSGTVSVTTPAGCEWTAVSSASWLGASPAAGTGAATVTFTAPANPSSSQRTATLTIGGQVLTVTQQRHAAPRPPAHPRVVRIAP